MDHTTEETYEYYRETLQLLFATWITTEKHATAPPWKNQKKTTRHLIENKKLLRSPPWKKNKPLRTSLKKKFFRSPRWKKKKPLRIVALEFCCSMQEVGECETNGGAMPIHCVKWPFFLPTFAALQTRRWSRTCLTLNGRMPTLRCGVAFFSSIGGRGFMGQISALRNGVRLV